MVILQDITFVYKHNISLKATTTCPPHIYRSMSKNDRLQAVENKDRLSCERKNKERKGEVHISENQQ